MSEIWMSVDLLGGTVMKIKTSDLELIKNDQQCTNCV